MAQNGARTSKLALTKHDSPLVTTGLSFRPAETISDAVAAWQLVYNSYRKNNLIKSNRYRIHTSPQAASEQTSVITGKIGPMAVTTMSAILDGAQGLPLDRVYAKDLDELRDAGRTLMEVGLFADRRDNLARSSESLLQLMRYVWHWGMHIGVTDFIIGIHPRHAKYYSRAFGFEQFADPKAYAAVNDRPVVLLRGEPEIQLNRDRIPRGLQYFSANPIDLKQFDSRYLFNPIETANSVIGRYLDSETENLLGESAA
jgi:hypothetical protein